MKKFGRLWVLALKEMLFPPGCPRLTPMVFVLSLALAAFALGSHFGQRMEWVQALSITKFRVFEGITGWKNGLPEIRHGEVWRLLSPMFLHYGVLHLIGNCVVLWFFGTQFEWRYGRARFLLFIVAAELFNNVVMYQLRGPYFGGISGPIFSLFGFLFWRAKVQRVRGVEMEWVIPATMLLVLVLPALGLGPRSSLTGHLTGLLFGFFVAAAFQAKRTDRHEQPPLPP